MPRTPAKIPSILTVTLNPAIDLELEVAEFHTSGVLRATSARRGAGGKGLNVARVLATLGAPVTAAAVAHGPEAAVFEALLAGEKFSYARLGKATPAGAKGAAGQGVRTNVTLSAAGGPVCKVNQPGVPLPPAAWPGIQRQVAALCRGKAWVVLAGTLPPGLRTTAYRDLARTAHRAGAQVAIDAAGPALQAALAARPDLVKINMAELHETAQALRLPPGRGWRAVETALAALLKAGARTVVVTEGPGRILAAGELFPGEGSGPVEFTPPAIQPRGKVGSGDAFLAGLLAALVHGKSGPAALRQAAAAGAATSALPDPLFPTAKAIRQLEKSLK